jgi:putative nucleotidyltransferase with HDIG domain
MILAALTLLTGSFTVKIPSVTARISVSEAFVFTAVLLFGPSVATLIVALDSFVISLWMQPNKRSTVRSLFNLAAVALAIWISSKLFFVVVGAEPGSTSYLRLAIPLFVLAGSYFVLNSWLVAFAVAAQRGVSPYSFWRDNFPWLSLNYFGGASVAGLLVAYTRSVDVRALGVIIPLLVISYLTYKTTIGRVEDARLHVDQVNSLYMATIEALAMAVDAKDQITHGHIRRVQVYATELAKRLGVTDPQQLMAIEAAALLHDMGKLAIPEHILNKPGKLTAGEFEKMKRHADIGADLLSSIPFPYPVVPIVRHHHENWDGTGYPNKIAGTDIPLGARILSVVDCFDALTSDRPYRPKLSDAAAFDILRDRRGTMYDSLVVDSFIESHASIAPAAIAAGQQARSLLPPAEILGRDQAARALVAIREESSESAALVEARKLAAKASSISELITLLGTVIRQLTPATVAAVYEYQPVTDTIRCTFAIGDPDGLLATYEMPGGERISGWVAANGTSIVNSSATLDLGNVADAFTPTLKSALSTPVNAATGRIGVLTLYSTLEQPFNERHQYIADQIAAIVSDHLWRSIRRPSALVAFPEHPKTQSRR